MNYKSRIILFFSLVLILNLIWEFSHYGLYNAYIPIKGNFLLIIAGFLDMFFVGLIFLLVSLKNRKINWIKKPRIGDYTLIVLSGLLISILIEIISINFLRLWSYKPGMLLIFGVGLSPLLQLFLTTLISLEISRKFNP